MRGLAGRPSADGCGAGFLGAIALALSGLAAGAVVAGAAVAGAEAEEDVPTAHFSVPNPATLSDADAETIYRRLSGVLEKGYRVSKHPVARSYQGWARFNRTPYRSATHGERFVNNYANGIGRAYGDFEQAGTLPEGSIVAKDSFAVTADGDVMPGPLFVMEKMRTGFNPAGRDWRYTMIMPDGSVFGVTNGVDSDKVRFCMTCHARAGAAHDHLYFLPPAYR